MRFQGWAIVVKMGEFNVLHTVAASRALARKAAKRLTGAVVRKCVVVVASGKKIRKVR